MRLIVLFSLAFVLLLSFNASAQERLPISERDLYTRWEVFTTKNSPLPHDIVFAVRVDGDDVWFGTDDGVACYNTRTKKWRVYKEEDGLAHQACTSIWIDKKRGLYWFGTLRGVSRFDGKNWVNYTEENSGLINNVVYGVAVLGDELWVATTDGIGRFNIETGEWWGYHATEKPFYGGKKKAEIAPLEEVWVYGVDAGPKKVYFAVWGGGLVEYDPAHDHWQAYHDPDGSFELNLFPDDGPITQMMVTPSYAEGNVWMGSYFGMSRYDGRNWYEYDQDHHGLASNFMNFIKAKGTAGYGCTDKGLSVYDYAKKIWINYQRREGIGAYGMITITDEHGKILKTIVTETSIPHNFVWGVDFQGEDVWVGTSGGVGHGMKQ